MARPFVGPSYTLAIGKASRQRSVNLHLVGLEAPEKAPFILASTPGLIQRWSLGAEIRGGLEVGSRAFVVAGSTLHELFADFTSAPRGTLSSSSGVVDFAYGLSQLVLVDGDHGYTLAITSNTFAQITADGFYGSSRVAFINNRFVFTRPGTQQYEWSAVDDASDVAALDFASAEYQPDKIIAHLTLQDDLMFLGDQTTEFHYQTGDPGLPFQRSNGVGFEIGCAAVHSAQKIDNGVFWIGRDKNGSGIVYRLNGRQPQRISTQSEEQALRKSTDLSAARAFCYQQDGLTFYCLSAPGLTSTLCYEISTGEWHDRNDLDELGQFKAHRGTTHLYAFGRHLLGTADGKLLELDHDTYTNDGDPLVRERVSPHEAIPGRMRLKFNRFWLDCITGEAPQGVDPHVELSYSGDSGATWSNPVTRSIGAIGERFQRVLWTRLGMGRDRLWNLRFSGNAPFSIIDAGSDVEQGNN
jgi:hypothetical protein